MIQRTVVITLFLILGSNVFADGFSPMNLKKVLLEVDTIILVELIGNQQTIKRKNKGKEESESVTYTYDIKSKVLSAPVGDFTEEVFNTQYSLVLEKGVWLAIRGSGLEGNMKAGEKYAFLLKKHESRYSLQRAEKAEMLEKILQLKKEQIEDDKRIAKEQRKIPDGIYDYSNESDAQAIRLVDGRRGRLGDKCKLDILQTEITAGYSFELRITLASGEATPCILMTNGNAYWLYENTAVGGYIKEKSPSLHGFFNDKKDAEAVAKALKVSIVYPKSQTKENAK